MAQARKYRAPQTSVRWNPGAAIFPVPMYSPEETSARWNSDREPYPGAGFRQSGDVWDLSHRKTMAHPSQTVRFVRLPEWLKGAAKDFCLHGILVERYSNGYLARIVDNLYLLVDFLSKYHPDISNLAHLTAAIGDAFSLWLQKTDELRPYKKADVVDCINSFCRWLRVHYGEAVQGFGIRGKFRYKKQHKGDDKVIPAEVRDQIIVALKVEEEHLRERIIEAERRSGPQAKAATLVRQHLIMCQIMKVLLWTGRRISHTLFLKRNPEVPLLPGDPSGGLRLVYNETKLDRGEQQVFVPLYAAELVRDAIRTAQEMVDAMIDRLSPGHPKPYLFMTRTQKGDFTHLTAERFRQWVNGYTRNGRYFNGFMDRHDIRYNGEIYHFLPHDTRHTRASLLRRGGATMADVRQDLKHLSLQMPYVYTHADETRREELAALYQRQLVDGKAAAFFGNSGESRLMLMKWFTPGEVELMLKTGLRLQKTIYGGCCLPLEAGPCPSADPCWIGPDGDGCKWYLFGPDDYSQVEADLEAEREQLSVAERTHPRSPVINHLRNRTALGERVLTDMTAMRLKRGAADG